MDRMVVQVSYVHRNALGLQFPSTSLAEMTDIGPILEDLGRKTRQDAPFRVQARFVHGDIPAGGSEGLLALLTGFVSCSSREPEKAPDLPKNGGLTRLLLAVERSSVSEGLFPTAFRAIDRGEKMAEESGDREMLLLFRFDRGYAMVKSGQPEEGFAWMQENLEGIGTLPNQLYLTSALGFLADAYDGEERYEEAIDVCVRRLDHLTQLYDQDEDRDELNRQYFRASKELAHLLAVTGQVDSLVTTSADSLGWVGEDVLSQATRYLSLHHLEQKNAEVGWKAKEARRNLRFACLALLALLLVTGLLIRVLRDSRRLSEKNRQLVKNLEAVNQYRKEVARLKEEAADSDEWKRSAQQVTDAELLGRLDALMEKEALYRDSELNLKTLAQTLSVPQSRLEALFRNLPDAEGLSDYLNRKRLLYACKLLKENPYLKVSAVCESAGFTSLSVFQRYFKKEMGMTAAEYRAAIRE